MNIWTVILGPLVKPILEGIARRGEIKHEEKKQDLENKKALQEATVKAVEEGRSLDNLWELESLKNSGWKDEFWTILFAIPVVAVFIPWFQPFIQKGFIILEQTTPDWYRWLLVMMVSASFGVRVWRRI